MTEYTISVEDLREMQSRSFERKVNMTLTRILDALRECNGKCYVAFSGGKDSAVLLHMVARAWKLYGLDSNPLHVIFSNTGNEYLSIVKFVPEFCSFVEETIGITIDLHMVRPNMDGKPVTFIQVCKTVGYPIASKKISNEVSKIRKQFKELGYSKSETKQLIQELSVHTRRERAETLRELGFNKTCVLHLSGINSKDKESPAWELSKRWQPLIWAPFSCSDRCCEILKKNPSKHLAKELGLTLAFIGEMASDGENRKKAYLQTGCNAFKNGHGKSKPMGFWLNQDVLMYHKFYKLPHAECYGKLIQNKSTGELKFSKMSRTGCKLCLFGIQMGEGSQRLTTLYNLEPKVVDFALKSRKSGGLGYGFIQHYIQENCNIRLDLPDKYERSKKQ